MYQYVLLNELFSKYPETAVQDEKEEPSSSIKTVEIVRS